MTPSLPFEWIVQEIGKDVELWQEWRKAQGIFNWQLAGRERVETVAPQLLGGRNNRLFFFEWQHLELPHSTLLRINACDEEREDWILFDVKMDGDGWGWMRGKK